VSTAMTHVPNPGRPGRDADQKVPVRKPTVFDQTSSTKASQEQFDKLLGAAEPIVGAPSSGAGPPDAPAAGPTTPTQTQRSSATSVLGGAL
jgi:hypothetical protein